MICIDSNPPIVEVDQPCHAQEQDQVSTSFHHFFTAARAVWISQAALQQHLLQVAIGLETQAAKCSESRGNYPWVLPFESQTSMFETTWRSKIQNGCGVVCDMLKQTNVMKPLETETIPVHSSHRLIFVHFGREGHSLGLQIGYTVIQ